MMFRNFSGRDLAAITRQVPQPHTVTDPCQPTMNPRTQTMLQRNPTPGRHRARRRTAILLGRLALAGASLSVVFYLANAYLNR